MKKKLTYLDILAWFIIVLFAITFLVSIYCVDPLLLVVLIAVALIFWAIMHLALKEG